MMDKFNNRRIVAPRTADQTQSEKVNQSLGDLAESSGRLLDKIRQTAKHTVGRLAEKVGASAALTSASYDGQFLGAQGTMYHPSTPLSEVSPFLGRNPKAGAPTIILINGIDCDQREARRLASKTANLTGHPVAALFNQTLGVTAMDVFKVFFNKAGIASTAVVSVARDLVVDAVLGDKELFLGAHSHGAIVASMAIARAKKDLKESHGFDSAAIEAALFKLVRLETYAGAATQYPDGPRYIHFVDESDPIAWWLGVARHELPSEEIAEKSRGIKLLNSGLAVNFELLGQNTQELIEPGRDAQIARLPHDKLKTFNVAHSLINHLIVRDRLLAAIEGR